MVGLVVIRYIMLHTILLLMLKGDYINNNRQPNIVIALADDLGWSDVGYHNVSGIKTPHIDKLAQEGIILNNHYVQPLCSPSRASLLTGKYPIHIGAGLNDNVFAPDEEAGLPLSEKLLPEYLKDLGYSTALFGKWHLGLAKSAFLPTRRGFDRFYGFYTGAIDYYRHNQTAYRCLKVNEPANYLDLRDQEKVVRSKEGQYSSALFNKEALNFIDSSGKENPFFLLMSYQNVHSPLQVPKAYSEKYNGLLDKNRQIYSGMATYLDDSVYNLTERIQEAGVWNNTLIIFMSDNGGNPTASGYNWPLRGAKGTLWEGGIRSPTFLSGGFLKKSGFESSALVHVSDWLPTLLNLARNGEHRNGEHRNGQYRKSGHVDHMTKSQRQKPLSFEEAQEKNREKSDQRINRWKDLIDSKEVESNDRQSNNTMAYYEEFSSKIDYSSTLNQPNAKRETTQPMTDGIDVWKAITSLAVESPRKYIIHNINNQSYAIRKGKWKLIKEVDMGWAEPPEGSASSTKDRGERPLDPKTFKGYLLDPYLPRVRDGLFDMSNDKSERHDLSSTNPEKVKELLKIIEKYKKTKVSSHRVYKCNLEAVKKAKEVNAWGPFLD